MQGLLETAQEIAAQRGAHEQRAQDEYVKNSLSFAGLHRTRPYSKKIYIGLHTSLLQSTICHESLVLRPASRGAHANERHADIHGKGSAGAPGGLG